MGLGAVLILWISFRGYHWLSKEEDTSEEYPEGIRAGQGPIPPLLLLVYVGFVLWALGYVLVVGLGGPPF